MRADQHVDRTQLEILQHHLDLAGRPETRDHLDPHGKRCEPCAKRVEVLRGQHRRRRQHRDLEPVLHRLERGAHRHLGLAEAHVADQQPVHRPRRLHVFLDLGRRALLVGRQLEGEGGLELALPLGVAGENVALRRLAPGVELEQLAGHRLDRLAHARLDPLPSGSAQLVQLRLVAGHAVVLLHEVEPIDGHEQTVAAGELEHHEVAVEAAALGPPQAGVARDAVIDVDDQRAFLQIPEVRHESGSARFLPVGGLALLGEQIAFGIHAEA